MEGRSGLYPKKRFTSYPSSLKLAAVEDYLGGGGSLDAMCQKYRIASHAVLQQWITLYHEGHRDFKTRRAQEESGMAEKNKLSYEEKLQAVLYCIGHRLNYRQVNHKRIYGLMKSVHMQAVIHRKKKHYVMSEPRITAENVLNRAFTANRPNEKWVTDVTEFKLLNGEKAYLSAILDLHDKSIVAYALGQSNNNQLVFDTFDSAVRANPSAHPLFHSDRGYQYTNRQFKAKLDGIHATQSMSRPGRCIDNGPMEGFWGILFCTQRLR